MTPTLSAMLKEKTADQHHRAEQGVLERQLARGELDQRAYVAMIAQRYLVHRKLEALQQHTSGGRDELIQLAAHGVTDAAAEDLRHLGVEPANVTALPATQRALAMLDDLGVVQPLALLGVRYVLEGSKNGARYLSRVVAKAYGLQGQGTRYMDPHGEDQPRLWGQWKANLDALELTPAQRSTILDAARRTFDAIADIDEQIMQTLGLGDTASAGVGR